MHPGTSWCTCQHPRRQKQKWGNIAQFILFVVNGNSSKQAALAMEIKSEFKHIFQDTALHLASRAGQPKVVDLLLSLGAKISLNTEDKSFLDIAIENRKAAVALTSVKHER